MARGMKKRESENLGTPAWLTTIEEPVSLAQLDIKLITKKRVKLLPMDSDDIYRRIGHQKRDPSAPGVQLPIPLPKSKPRSVSKDARLEVEAMQFMARAVEPKTTRAGFITFDISDLENPLAGARLEISGLRREDGQELFYFSIPMEKYLSYKPQ